MKNIKKIQLILMASILASMPGFVGKAHFNSYSYSFENLENDANSNQENYENSIPPNEKIFKYITKALSVSLYFEKIIFPETKRMLMETIEESNMNVEFEFDDPIDIFFDTFRKYNISPKGNNAPLLTGLHWECENKEDSEHFAKLLEAKLVNFLEDDFDRYNGKYDNNNLKLREEIINNKINDLTQEDILTFISNIINRAINSDKLNLEEEKSEYCNQKNTVTDKNNITAETNRIEKEISMLESYKKDLEKITNHTHLIEKIKENLKMAIIRDI